MSNIKVSVIVPVYNVEQYLPQCLDSLVNQTLDKIEILIINDGSLDHSQHIIDTYVQEYPNKIRSFLKPNGGLSDARNYGVALASGEYIGFIDSDDYARTDMFELLYNKAVSENSDVAVCDIYRSNGNSSQPLTNIKHPDLFNHKVYDNPEILLESKSYAWNKIYRRQWYQDNLFSFPVGQWFEDSAVVYNMLYLANNVSAVPECLYYYRTDRDDSITNTVNPKIYHIFSSCENMLSFFRNNKTTPALMTVVERLCSMHLFVRIPTLIKNGSLKERYHFYNKMMDFLDTNFPDWSNNPYYKKDSNRSFYTKIRHRRPIMYLFLLCPKTVFNIYNKIKAPKKSTYNYISHFRLKELQLIELEILKEIDRICKEHHITYYLGEGTLLGAVRHHGFIPWDDDLDIVMPRSDYNHFLNIVSDLLDPKYICLNHRTNPSYYLTFTKIISIDNKGFVNRLDKFEKTYNGPFVDIFPVDFYHTKAPKSVQHTFKKIRFFKDLLLLKADYMDKTELKRKPKNIIAKCFSYKQLHNILNQEMTACSDTCEYMCNFASSYHPMKQIVSKEVYGTPVYIPFEDGLFPVPQDADTLLKTIYGDYMQIPPLKDRVCRHSFFDQNLY